MIESREIRNHTTPPVLLWSSGGRTAWGRTVVFHNPETTRRLRGGEARTNHIIDSTSGETSCSSENR